MFFCAMMGRTSSTITTDSTTLPELQPIYNSSLPDFDQELGLMESAHAFLIMERIVKEIYTQHTVPLGLLQRLSIELQEASSNVPTELRTLEISNSSHQSPHTSQRPFLITSLRAKCNRGRTEGRSKPEDSKVYADIIQGAMASIDAAIKTIQLLHELLEAGMLFNNMPLVVAWTFVSALTICSAYFGQLGNLNENEYAIQQADEVLKHFTRNSPQARRYSLILTKVSKAALDYVKYLEHKERVARNRLMPELFRLKTAQSENVRDYRLLPLADLRNSRPGWAR
ncbi:hypothetical protein ZTR_09615 [Talaromyces verruculosus]|nr:hypothetical protein ZTR_09615 [Talaromyces verruculosus]